MNGELFFWICAKQDAQSKEGHTTNEYRTGINYNFIKNVLQITNMTIKFDDYHLGLQTTTVTVAVQH